MGLNQVNLFRSNQDNKFEERNDLAPWEAEKGGVIMIKEPTTCLHAVFSNVSKGRSPKKKTVKKGDIVH